MNESENRMCLNLGDAVKTVFIRKFIVVKPILQIKKDLKSET